MRRALGLALAALALASAGVLAALVPSGSAQAPPPTDTATTATTVITTAPAPTETVATTTAPVTTAPPPAPKPRPKPKADRLPDRVTIGGIHVGGLTPAAASDVVRAAFRAPLVVLLGERRVKVSPASLRAVAYIQNAVAKARRGRRGAAIPLVVAVHGAPVRSLVDSLAARFDRDPVDSKLFLRGLAPYLTPGAPGKRLVRPSAVETILRALRENRRTGIELPVRDVPQAVSRDNFGPVIVIRRGSNRLHLYDGMKPRRVFGVATGQSVYPTPLGRFQIVVKWRNPWWYPPASPWAKGAKPIPPGPGNPLGTRWMGLSSPGVGIHGTPDSASIGYSVSHGCIRMFIPQAEWLFEQVEVGTPVYIVAD